MKKKKEEKENMIDGYKEIFQNFFLINVINIEIIKLMEIYSIFGDRFILMELLYRLLGLSKNSLIK